MAYMVYLIIWYLFFLNSDSAATGGKVGPWICFDLPSSDRASAPSPMWCSISTCISVVFFLSQKKCIFSVMDILLKTYFDMIFLSLLKPSFLWSIKRVLSNVVHNVTRRYNEDSNICICFSTNRGFLYIEDTHNL